MSEQSPRIIKKYSNRRLYDKRQSRYITLDELKDLVLAGEDFRVLTTQGEDITSQTLITMLVSGEVMGQPVFSERNLRNMVMFMNGPMRGPLAVFFDQCMPLFARSQKELMEKFGASVGGKELESLAVLQGNFVRQMMEQYVCRGLENYLTTQKNMEKMMAMQPFPFSAMYSSGGEGESFKK